VQKVNAPRQSGKETTSQKQTNQNFIVEQYPYQSLFTSLLIFVGPWILLLPLFLLQAVFSLVLVLVGFGKDGVTRGKYPSSSPSSTIEADINASRITRSVVSIQCLRCSHTSQFSLRYPPVNWDTISNCNGEQRGLFGHKAYCRRGGCLRPVRNHTALTGSANRPNRAEWFLNCS
jgi:hypothetical protein